MASQGTTSRLAQMQMRYQAKQQLEREQKRIELGSTTQRPMTNLDSGDNKKLGSSLGVGKVRQMFHERRQRGTGIDKSYPLQPINTRTSPTTIPLGTLTTSATTTAMTSTLSSSKYLTNGRKTVGSVNGGDNVKKPITLSSSAKRFIVKNTMNGHSDDIDSIPNSPDEFGDDFLDNEQFPDTSLTFDDDLNNNYQIAAAKLPNVGKINTKLIKNNNINDNHISNNINNNNTMKLKPIIPSPTAKKSTIINTNNNNNINEKLLTPTKTLLNGNRKITPISKVKPLQQAPSSILRANNNSLITKTITETTEKNGTIKTVQKNTPMVKIKPKTASGGTIKSKMQSQQSAGPPENSLPCRVCGRYFLEDRLGKHESICLRTSTKKRKVFDITKHRTQGTEAEAYVKKSSKAAVNRPKSSVAPAGDDANVKKNDWRRKHEEFINAIRAAKEIKQHLARGGKLSDLPPPPPSENLDYITCPHCSRRFNQAAAERHIPKCATMLHNKPRVLPRKK